MIYSGSNLYLQLTICHCKVTDFSLHIGEGDGVVVGERVVVVFVDDGDGGAGHGGDLHYVHVVAVDAVGDGGVAEYVEGEFCYVQFQLLGYAAEPKIDGLEGATAACFPYAVAVAFEFAPVCFVHREWK